MVKSTALAAALDGSGMSGYALALRLGVSRQAVSRWVQGKAPLPVDRVAEIAEVLGASEDVLRADSAEPLDGSPVTVFGSLIANDGPLFDLGRSPEERAAFLAKSLGVGIADVRAWARGADRIPFEVALDFMHRYLPGLNPIILEGEVAADTETEVDALVRWVGSELHDADTFTEAARSLELARYEWEMGAKAESLGLDDGRPVPEVVLDRLARVDKDTT